MGRYRRRKRLKKIWMLPPVILAAIFIWTISVYIKNRNAAENSLASRWNASDESVGQSGSGTGTGGDSGHGSAKADSNEIRTLILDDDSICIAGGQKSPNGESLDSGQGTDELTLLFGGDIYLSSHVLNAYDKAGGIEGVLDDGIRNVIDSADIFMCNEEFPFSERGTPEQEKEYTFRLSPSRAPVMQEIGPDIVALANNHSLDYGTEALLDTCEVLDNAGILYVGAGADLEAAKALKIIETKGKRIGFLAASRVFPNSSWAAAGGRPGVLSTYDPGILLKEIEDAKSECDYLVVYVHWGIEKNTKPEEYQRILGKQYIDAGADIVVGSHPHVLQGIEYYKGNPIIYSLGNFVFGSSIPRTALLEVKLSAESLAEENSGVNLIPALRLVPCTSSAGYTRLLPSEKQAEFYQNIQELSFEVSVDEQGVVTSGD